MSDDYPKLRKELNAAISQVRKGLPELTKATGALHRAAYADAALDARTKELIALAIAVAIRCDGCLAFHANGALAKGASREEVLEALGVAIQMGGGPAMVYGSQALKAYDQFAAAKK